MIASLKGYDKMLVININLLKFIIFKSNLCIFNTRSNIISILYFFVINVKDFFFYLSLVYKKKYRLNKLR